MRKRIAVFLFLALVFLAACSQKDGEALLIINGKPLSAEEVRYLITTTISVQEIFGSSAFDWNGTIDGVPTPDFIKNQAVSMAASSHAIELKAAELGHSLTGEELAEIDALIGRDTENAGGKDAFDRLIENQYGTIEVYRYYNYTIPMLNEKLNSALCSPGKMYWADDAEVTEFYKNNFTNVSSILISAVDDEGMPLEGEELEIQLKVAESLLKKVKNGEDFFALVREHGQDYAMSLTPEGIPVAKGVYGDEFDEALAKLSENEVSDVVATRYGFYIIKRLPENMDYLAENFEMVRDNCVSEKFLSMVNEWSRSIKIERTKYFEDLNLQKYVQNA